MFAFHAIGFRVQGGIEASPGISQFAQYKINDAFGDLFILNVACLLIRLRVK